MKVFRHLILLPILFSTAAITFGTEKAKAEYWLVIGSYRQGPGRRPVVSGITSPSLYAIPMRTLKECKAAGEKISEDIYKPVWQFDNRWTCVYRGPQN